MSDYQLASLIKWLKTAFSLQVAHSCAEDISDGVALSEALEQIAPEWFSLTIKSKIKTDVGSNWRLRVSNLKKIVEAVMEYYSECLNQPLSGYKRPDAEKIGKHCDPIELCRLLQLILGCAVNCIHKQQYITQIMKMEVSVQQIIMQNIQELEGHMQGGPRMSLGASLSAVDMVAADELHRVVEMREQLSQKCHELDQQLTLLQEERATLVNENKKLQKRLDEFVDNQDLSTPSNSLGGYSALRKQIENLKDELFKMETSRDDYRLRVELLEKEVIELQSKQEELQKAADERNNYKDEIDALRETADKAIKYEQTIASYKKKLDDLSDLRRQVKLLEEKNLEHMQLKMVYEEAIKQSSTVRNNLELCKQQLSECHHKLDQQTSKCEQLEYETKKLEAKLSSVQREKERLIIERDALKETNEELKCTQLQTAENTTPTIKQKILLEHNEKLPIVQLDDSEQRLNVLREKNCNENNTTDLQHQIIELQGECERLLMQVEEKETCAQTWKQKVATLQETVARKESENLALEERYKKYIEKAKNVIRCLNPTKPTSSSQSDPCDLIVLRNLKETKLLHEMEEKLMVSAFYHLGYSCQRESTDQRLAAFSSRQGNSFLARQRQPSARRNIHVNNYNSK